MLFKKEHYDLLSNFENQFKHRRLDKEKKDMWHAGVIYQDGHVNELFLAFRRGYAFGVYQSSDAANELAATPAAPSQPAVSQGEQIVGYRISHPSEPDLGTWLAEEAPNDQTDLLIEPLVLAATQSQQVTVTQCDLAKLRDTIVVLMLIAKSVGVLDDISSASEFLADEAARLKKQPKGRTGNDLVAWTIDYLREKEGKR